MRVAFFFYLAKRPPDDVMPMDDGSTVIVAWVSLAVAILSLATAVVGLV